MAMSDNVYKVLGYSYGSFKDRDSGKEVVFQKISLAKPIKFPETSNAQYAGYSAGSFRAADAAFLMDLNVGDWVLAFFDNAADPDKRKVAFVQKLDEVQLAAFGVSDPGPI